VGIFANVLILPVIPISMFLSFLVGLGGMVSDTLGQVFSMFSFPVLGYGIWIIAKLSRLPFASLSFPGPSLWWIILMYIAIAILFFKPKTKFATTIIR
ncbi:MAG: ComEC/Rec2 family competence protein, partial [Candidatus Paceibacteria bacterium]